MDTKDSVIAYLPVGRDSLFDRTVYFSNTLVAEKHLLLAATYIRDLSNGSAKYNDGGSRCFSPRVNGYIYRVTPMSEYAEITKRYHDLYDTLEGSDDPDVG